MRVALVSPTIDQRHGTERWLVEWVRRLSGRCEFHLYSSRVEDIPLGDVVWHRIPRLPGPHLAGYLWWFFANQAARRWHQRRNRCRYDLVVSPGINCLDADVICVHIVFGEFRRQMAGELAFGRNPIRFWPRLLHRRLYYALAIALERRVYPRREVTLLAVSQKTARDLGQFCGRSEPVPVVYLGIDRQAFNPRVRSERRAEARRALGLADDTFTLLLVGNDWKKKGLPAALEALAGLHDLPVCLLVVGEDDARPYQALLEEYRLAQRVRFLAPRADVSFYYAAADAYLGPSVEDAFAQPPAEAMASGLPAIVSSAMGVAEIVTDGQDGFVLADPRDAAALRERLRQLYKDPARRRRMGENAARTAEAFSWERNAAEVLEVFEQALERKTRRETPDRDAIAGGDFARARDGAPSQPNGPAQPTRPRSAQGPSE